jgi:23S rRNA pseudouridine2604 synthase
MTPNNDSIRINRYLSEKGLATRKEADVLISSGNVVVNGKKAVLGQKITPGDTVEIRNRPTKNYGYFIYNKPRGITTHPEKNTEDIVSVLKKNKSEKLPKLFPVGRLDKDSSGLIIMTNDGRVTDKLLNPRFYHEKEYQVTVNKEITPQMMAKLAKGVRLGDGTITRPAKIHKLGKKQFSIIITEGKNRQIRRMCEVVGFHVETLARTRIMNITVGNLKEGSLVPISKEDCTAFLAMLGLQ